jgi:adenylate cyclase
MTLWKSALLGLTSAVLFTLLYIADILGPLEDRLYDYFLRFRADREPIDSVVFLDIDDPAIAYNGIFPWPRSIPADGLLRLKEYGTMAAIFDIEFIDRGPQGVDNLYLDRGLGNDFDRSFSEINLIAQEILSAIKAGRISRNDMDYYAGSLSSMIGEERKNLYTKAQNVARDNDRYLAQALKLFDRSWSTLNLRSYPLDGEQAERRPIAERRFSYPVTAAPDAHLGAGFVDILPALPIFAEAAKGAGYTNAEIDNDGIRRRVYLAQNIYDHWYLQLAFAPLIDYLGRPEILLEKRKLTVKGARLPDGKIKDIVIPLDSRGRMMLDWPKQDYAESYTHISFADFSLLDEIEAELEEYSRALASADLLFFAQFDYSLATVPVILSKAGEFFDAARMAKNNAMEYKSDDAFDAYLEYRNQSYALLTEVLALDVETKVQALVSQLSVEYPESAAMIEDEAEYISQLVYALDTDLERRNELTESNDRKLRDKFCVLGRVDTGTTDYGANPFYGKYINVGTHGVVLDTILSETFIIPLGFWWYTLFMLIFIPLFFLASARLSPVPRAAAGFAVTMVIIAGTVALFRFTGIFLAPLGTVLAIISAVIAREIMSYADSEKEKHFLHTAFSTYVSGDVVKEIIADPSRLQLGGTKRHMTAIFTDVRGFSTISEKLDPEDLVSLLNRYLSAMSDIVLAEKGTIDKYEGDAIIAFFGAPLELEDHALRACVSAITMKRYEAELNKIIIQQKLSPLPLLTRIGINTGNMVAGNMGTQNKMNYTIMGNAVNLAARLEGVNKQYGTWVLASDDTVRETGSHVFTRKLDRVRVVGINEPVRLHELIETVENTSDEQRRLVQIFHEALDCFEQRRWKQAAAGFKEALSMKTDDFPSQKYFERCVNFMKKPPEDTWDGVYNLTEK